SVDRFQGRKYSTARGNDAVRHADRARVASPFAGRKDPSRMSLIPPQIAPVGVPSAPDIEWEETPCLLCGGRRCSVLLEAAAFLPGGAAPRFAVFQCHAGGLCSPTPRPRPPPIGQFSPPLYRPHQPRVKRRRFRLRPLAFFQPPRKERQALPWHG